MVRKTGKQKKGRFSLKILYVTTVSGTINAFLIPHIKMLLDLGHQVDIACHVDRPINNELIERECKVFHLEFSRSPLKKQNYVAYKKLKQLIKDEQYTIVHTHTPVASACVRAVCRNMKNVKVIYTAHGFHFFKGAPKKNWMIYNTIEKICGRWTDAVITMNHEDYRYARKMKLRTPQSAYYVHGVGLDLNKFRPQLDCTKKQLRDEYGYKRSDFILIYVGELSYRKNQKLLIKAIDLIKDKVPNIRLLLIGDGPLEKDYKGLVDKLQLTNYIEFLGYRTDVPNLMGLSDIAVSSSRQEGLPVNVMEAMATGLPLVVTNSRGNSDLVNHGENGFVVENFNDKQFADAIVNLYKSKEIRRKFGQCSLHLVNQYSQENAINELKEVYGKLM